MRSRFSIVLLLLLVFGVPALITWNLIRTDVSGLVTSGHQPPGKVTGRVTGPDGEPLAGIEVVLWAVGTNNRMEAEGTTHTAADGTFELATPDFVGSFELHAGGDPWVRLRRRFSFLDADGNVVALEPFELRLQPGSVLAVDFSRLDERPLGSGRYELVGRVESGPFGMPPAPYVRRGTFENGHLELDGLPPMRAKLRAEFTTGDRVEIEVELGVGRNERKIEI